MQYSHKCFGSQLDITIRSSWDFSQLVQDCFDMADRFEQKYSRFIDGNFLSELNTKKISLVDNEFISLIKLALQVSEMTQWYFDITVLPILENKGYGISDTLLSEDIGYKNIILTNNSIKLKNNISIDIGALWKGYMVDKIYNVLFAHIDEFIINFGGDIRIKWTEIIELEDPLNEKKNLGKIEINNMSIASSAGNKRIFSGWHHLINPKTWENQNDKQTLYVTHKLASFADIFSTALFVCPLELSLKILQKTKWLEGLIISADWKKYKSKWFSCIFNTK